VSGREELYAYCEARAVPHARDGKLLVATCGAQEGALRALAARGAQNGVRDLTWLSASQAAALEPRLRASAALLSPSSGIVDSHALMAALQADAEGARAALARRCGVLRACCV
jgi:L-2-hydroxyglutarate oxidase LhgO